MNGAGQSLGAIGPWALLFMAIAATYLWRGMGSVIAARLDPESRFLQWVACVAYGLLAALISRIVFLPVGILENTQLVDRLGATALGFVVFFAFKKHIGAGTLTAAGVFMLLVWARTQGML
ncbi:AzlD domain-containing protein [Thalassospiraceae bacterium LMO-JJ14]|nr:AzlD domain-containing protein [Thalassospiraceae bacterium LMO-JJ14]